MEKSAFVKVFGDSPMVRLLDFLLAERGLYDYSLTAIAENSNVSWATLHLIFPKLEKIGIVKKTRTISRAKMFMINEKNPLVQDLIKIRNKISDYFIKKELEKQSKRIAIKI